MSQWDFLIVLYGGLFIAGLIIKIRELDKRVNELEKKLSTPQKDGENVD